MKRFVLAIALTCALSGTALAGEIHTAGVQAPDPSSPVGTALAGEIHTTDAVSAEEPSELLATLILTIISLAVS